MSLLTLPLHPPFITRSDLVPLHGHHDILRLDVHYDVSHFSESLFAHLHIPLPDRLGKAVKKRRAEYLASRFCLQQAMKVFGIENAILHNDEERAPLWPAGIRGSLSHTHQRICALLTRRDDRLPGIDCEHIMAEQTAQEIAHRIINAEERALLSQTALPFALALTTIFSAKESLYKAVWPRLRRFLDFSAAEVIAWDVPNQRLILRLSETFSAEFYQGREMIVETDMQPDMVVTWVIGLPPASA